jgi:hypothetical protein
MQEAMGVGEDLRASIGVASGEITLAIAGSSQRLVFVLGPVVDEVVALETVAEAGEVVVSAVTLDGVDAWCRGVARSPGFVIAEAPDPPTSKSTMATSDRCHRPRCPDPDCTAFGAGRHRCRRRAPPGGGGLREGTGHVDL